MVQCKTCSVELVIGENWSPSRAKRNTRSCQGCLREYNRQWRKDNPEKVRARHLDGRQAASYARHYYGNLEKMAAKGREQRSRPEAKAKSAQRSMARYAKKKNLTPANADKAAIQAFYDLANLMTAKTGRPYHVDHIKSLDQGGFHHQDNLVVMYGPLNQSKGAQHWPWLTWFNSPPD